MKLLEIYNNWAFSTRMRHMFNINQTTLSFIIFGAVACTAIAHPADGLVAYYPMDGDAKDKGGSHLDGTLVGTVSTDDRYGKHNKALLFNGTTDLINCGNPSAFNFNGNFTLSAWVKQSGTQTARYIIAKYDFASGHDYGMGVAESAEPYGFVLGDGPGYEDLRGSGALNDNAWHSMTMVFRNGSTLNLYVDGALNASLSVGSYPPFSNSAPLTIGGLLPGYGFGGAIDDVKIYDQALSDSDIADIYEDEAPKPRKPAKPIAYYPMDGDAKDKGGSHLDGTLVGTVSTDDRYGKHNKALLFNGTTDLINCGNPSAFNFNGNFTLSAWVKQSGTQTARYIIAKYDFASGHDYGMGVAESAEPYGFVLGAGPGYEDLRGSGALNDNAWHSMTMVFRNGTTLNLYVDGALNASLSVGSYPPFSNSAPLTIGGLLPGYGFGGAIDDVKIYDQALSSAEIAGLFHADTH